MKKTKVFKTYLRLNERIHKKFDFLKEYNDLGKIFELQFRLAEANRTITADFNLKNILKKKMKFGKFFKLLLRLYVSFFSLFFKQKKIFTRSQAMSNFAEKKFLFDLKKKKIKTLGTCSFLNTKIGKIKYVLNNTFIYDVLERTSETYLTLAKYDVNNFKKLEYLFTNENFINEIKISYNKDLLFFQKILKKLNVIGLLIHSDQTPIGYILTQAAKKNKIKTAVLAHGTLSDTYMIAVLPLHSEKIFVWNKQSEIYINMCTSITSAEHLEGINHKKIILSKQQDKILFVFDSIIFINEKLENEFYDFIKQLNILKGDYDLICCLHPADEYKVNKKNLSMRYGIKWSTNNIYTEAENAKVVIGGVSSFLYESYYNGINTIQIKDLIYNYVEYQEFNDLVNHWKLDGVPQINYKEFLNNFKYYIEAKYFKNNPKNINTEKVLNFFQI